MPTRIQISVLLFCAAVVWCVGLAIQGVTVSLSYLTPFSLVVGSMAFLLTIFDNWIWKWPIWQGWLVHIPNLNGTWKGRLISDWEDPKTGKIIEPIESFYVVTQTYSKLQMKLMTEQSESELIAGNINRNEDGTFTVIGVYRNTPQLPHRGTSAIHFGGIVLNVIGKPPTGLTGHYWTDRDTKGELNYRSKSTKKHFDFVGAISGKYKE